MKSTFKEIKVCPYCLTQVGAIEIMTGECDECHAVFLPTHMNYRIVKFRIVKELSSKFLFFKKYNKIYKPYDEFSKQWLIKNNYL